MWVVNHGEKTLEDGFIGVRYTFPPNVPVEVEAAVANHVFGYGDDDKTPYLTRLGWMKTNVDFDEAKARLNRFSFHSEKPRPSVHSLSPVVVATVPIPVKGVGTRAPKAA